MQEENDFTKFYRKNLNLTNDEFLEFYETLSKKLTRTFRLNPISQFHSLVAEKLKNQKAFHLFKEEESQPFLSSFAESGLIYFQEIVSAIPVLFIKDGICLDLCASPGSKSTQLAAKGNIVIANEICPKRSNVLVTNLGRLGSNKCVVTNIDGSKYPSVPVDNVICDVPCSSDGTIRKNPFLLKSWTNKKALGLFKLQYKILKRAIRIVKDNGIVVYSTCSFNPIENEAVVQKILKEENVKLLDIRTLADKTEDPDVYQIDNDGFKFTFNKEKSKDAFLFREGLTNWDPFVDKTELDFFPSFLEDLKRCVRILPHDNNTGGFFIAIFCKLNNSAGAINILNPEKLQNLNAIDSTALKTHYDYTMDDIFLAQTPTIIRSVDPILFELLSSFKLKLLNPGIKAFEKSKLDEKNFRISMTYLNLVKSPKKGLNIGLDELALLLNGDFVEFNRDFEQQGSIIFVYKDFKFPGFTSKRKATIFVDKNMRKVLKELFNV